jgi:tetratricopeptide (TPR) repeat protein
MKWTPTATWITFAICSIGFWLLESQKCLHRAVLIVGLSLACFSIGSLAGFLFTSYGEETATVGKIRDWLIGGIAGLTVASLASIKATLLTFAAGPGPQEFALTVGVSVTYVVLGFFFMFFQRELFLNVELAQSRAQRGKIDGTSNAGIVALKFTSLLPPSVLSGVDDIGELVEEHDAEASELRTQLYSADVSKFLDEARDASKAGLALDWDVVSRVAVLHYYRTYFEKNQAKDKQERTAEEWLKRALVMNPNHADLRAKYADVLSMLERYDDAVTVIEPLAKSTDGPAYTRQWLGYFLLFVDREWEAIGLSEEYVKQFPALNHAYFNTACGYAQLYGEMQDAELRGPASGTEISKPKPGGPHPKMGKESLRAHAIGWLKEGLDLDPDYAEKIKEDLMRPDESFGSMADDGEFRKVLSIGILNAARKYAKTYKLELKESNKKENHSSKARQRAFKLLKDALELDPGNTRNALEAIKLGDSLETIKRDKEFSKIYDESKDPSSRT